MEKSIKNAFSFLLPYAIGLLLVRVGLDTLIKQMEWGYQGESYGGMIALIIEIGFIFLTIRNYKQFKNGGELLFSQGVRIGVGLMILMGTLFSIYVVMHGKYIDPQYQAKLAREVAELTKVPYNEGNSNTFNGMSLSILRYVFIGAFGAVICSAILKTEK